MREQDFLEIESKIDRLIRTAQGSKARKILLEIAESAPPRHARATLANLARRLNMNYLALRFLKKIVRSDVPIDPPAGGHEKTEYAAALSRIGAFSEAEELLASVQPDEVPQVLLFQAFNRIRQWKYGSCKRLLQRHIGLESLSPYQRLISKINLAAVYVREDDARAEELVNAVEDQTRKEGHRLLLANSLELKALLLISKKDYATAKTLLEDAISNVHEKGSHDEFLSQKWLAVVSALERPAKLNLERLEQIKNKALQIGHWETVRECDFYGAVVRRDLEGLKRVYIATPYTSYRRRMKIESGVDIDPPPSLDVPLVPWQIDFDMPCIDPYTGEANFDLEFLKRGQQLHRMLNVFTQDIYRPCSEGFLFSKLFAGEHFDPDSSPQRIQMSVRRLRKWLNEQDLPLKITVHQREYQLNSVKPIALILRKKHQLPEPGLAKILELKERWPYQTFSSKEASAILGSGRRWTNQFLKEMVVSGVIKQIGKGPATLYRFKNAA